MPGEISIYRLTSRNLDIAIRRDAGETVRYPVEIDGHRAVRVDRISDFKVPGWAAALERMTRQPYRHEVRSAGAVLLIDLGDTAYALTFGTGWRMLRPDAYEGDFGLKLAIRTLRHNRIAEVTRSALGVEARLDLTHMTGGNDVRAFGIEEYAEIVKKIGGKTDSLDITHREGRPFIQLSGRDALRVQLATDPIHLVHDLRTIERALAREPDPELAFIEGMRPVARQDPLFASGARALRDELAEPDSGRWGIGLPYGLLGVDVEKFEVDLAGRRHATDSVDYEFLTGLLVHVPGARRWETIRNSSVLVHVDGADDPLRFPLEEWITADLTAGGERLVLQAGQLYLVTRNYGEALRAGAERLMRFSPSWTLPAWPAGMHEGEYNEVAGSRPGFVNLDRALARSSTHPTGIEVCDLLSPDNQLICVKRAGRSSPLSHLFSQATVAAEALVDGDQTHQRLDERLPEGRRGTIPRRPGFVFAVQLTRADLTPQRLFTFSLVTLNRAARRLQRLNMPVALVGIPRD